MRLNPLSIASKPKQVEVTLITYEGNQRFVIQIANEGIRDFTYWGRLWALNDQFSQALKSPVYVEITEAYCKELRANAGMVMQIAARYEAQLEALKEPVKQ